MPSADHRGRVGMSRYPQQPRCYGSLDNALNNKIVARFKLILMLALLLSSITTLLLDAIVDQHYLICWLFFMPIPSFPAIRPSPVDSQDQGLFLKPLFEPIGPELIDTDRDGNGGHCDCIVDGRVRVEGRGRGFVPRFNPTSFANPILLILVLVRWRESCTSSYDC